MCVTAVSVAHVVVQLTCVLHSFALWIWCVSFCWFCCCCCCHPHFSFKIESSQLICFSFCCCFHAARLWIANVCECVSTILTKISISHSVWFLAMDIACSSIFNGNGFPLDAFDSQFCSFSLSISTFLYINSFFVAAVPFRFVYYPCILYSWANLFLVNEHCLCAAFKVRPNFPAPQFNLKIMLHTTEKDLNLVFAHVRSLSLSLSVCLHVSEIKTQFYVYIGPHSVEHTHQIYVCSKIYAKRDGKNLFSPPNLQPP